MKFIKKNLKLINTILFIIFLIMLTILLIKTFKKDYHEYSKTINYMDTYISIKIYSKNNAFEELNKIEKLYSEYNDLTDKYNEHGKNLYYINNTSEEVTIDSRLTKIINYGLDLYEKSDGLFNINIGCVTDIWKYYRDNENGIPKQSELNSCDTDISNIKLTGNKISGEFNIDLGGIAKGYVTELAGNMLEKDGFDYYIINAGGNVKASTKSDGSSYNVGIQSPIDNNSLVGILEISNKSVATSGGYERFYEYNGIKYHHIIDPTTLYPSNYMKSVSVVANNSSLADSLSTILFLMPIDEGKKFIAKYDAEAIWIDNNNNIISTNGITFDE